VKAGNPDIHRLSSASIMSRLTLLSLSSFFLASLCLSQTPTPSKQPVATVEGQTIYDEDLAPYVEGQLLSLRNQEYEIKKKALDNLIEQKLLEAAAKKKGLTTEKLLDQEVISKVPDPTDAQIEAFYLALKDRIKSPLDDAKSQLRDSFKQAEIRQVRQDYLNHLRADSNVVVLLSAPRIEVAHDAARVQGNPKPRVMIVEFSDYQCPYCKQAEASLKAVLAKYGDKVSLAYRDFPLSQIHPQAEIAAEASRCAQEQGKFWEYHDQLFTASKLDKDSLIEYARSLKLDDTQFVSCLTNEKYKAAIDKDREDGRKAGVTGTPGFFINGIALSGVQSQETFARVIDDELARKR
jgi:predicted DsbA family dithiol-disulfide isomerase